MMRPSTSRPTGTVMALPVSVTSRPRTRPSVVSMAMVRTVLSPRCCATSSTSSLPWFWVCSAFRIAGRSPSNCTSTTAPNTCVILPTRFLAIDLSFNPSLVSQRLGAGDDFDQFLGDIRLARAVVRDGQAVDHVAGVAGRAVHRRHARTLFAGRVLQQRAIDLHADVARQQLLQDRILFRLVLVAGIAGIRVLVGRACDRERDQLLRRHDLRHRRLELVVNDGADVELAMLEHVANALCNLIGGLELQLRLAHAFQAGDDFLRKLATQLIAPLAADAQDLDRLAVALQVACDLARLAYDRGVEAAAQAA